MIFSKSVKFTSEYIPTNGKSSLNLLFEIEPCWFTHGKNNYTFRKVYTFFQTPEIYDSSPQKHTIFLIYWKLLYYVQNVSRWLQFDKYLLFPADMKAWMLAGGVQPETNFVNVTSRIDSCCTEKCFILSTYWSRLLFSKSFPKSQFPSNPCMKKRLSNWLLLMTILEKKVIPVSHKFVCHNNCLGPNVMHHMM